MNFTLKSGNKTVANIRPRGQSWVCIIPESVVPFYLPENKVKSIFGACDFLWSEKEALSCTVFEFELVKIEVEKEK